LQDKAWSQRSREHADEMKIELTPAADPQLLLKRLMDTAATITKFEQVEPSLNDIFIDQVGGEK
jgi:ABC-type uncharacterized transport system ATPase subunit